VLVEPPPVITRQSSDIFAAEDPDVSAALRYIYENADRPMLVEQVADAVAVSRAHLDRRFRQFHGRTVQQEIWRAHVERAKRLLVTTQADTRAIARAAGFHNAQRLSVVFSREMRMTPSAYRKANTPR
jgi:LacI family transcriptional regulator